MYQHVEITSEAREEIMKLVKNSFLKDLVVEGYNEFNYVNNFFYMVEGRNELIENKPSEDDVIDLMKAISKTAEYEYPAENLLVGFMGDNISISLVGKPIIQNANISFTLRFIN